MIFFEIFNKKYQNYDLYYPGFKFNMIDIQASIGLAQLSKIKKFWLKRKKIYEKKGKITLQTGYGPSGLPHIGTFGEVVRTSMIVNALNHLTDLPKEIITFSDDMDGLRKIPDNIPQQKKIKEYLHKPLTAVPDPFEKYSSFLL